MGYPMTYHNVSIPNATVNYITAGSPENPIVLLLHGLPSSSNQFRNLIPLLAAHYFLVAPDLPFYGLTVTNTALPHTFDAIATTIGCFLDALKIQSFVVYIFDYGAPTGLRLALQRPHAIKAIISQSGNAYVEGLGDFWAPIQKYWKSGSQTDREALRPLLTLASTEQQYRIGVPADRQDMVNPVAYTFDYENNLAQKAQLETQLDLFYDYRRNVDLYPKFQEYFRKSQVPLLAVWGKNDPIFIAPGAEAFKKDLPHAKVKLLDGGHFLLESSVTEVAAMIEEFLSDLKL